MTSSNGTHRPTCSGVRMLALASLIALAACANATTAANDPAPGPTRVAGAAANNSDSVDKVSDALGQRLDGMLSQNVQHR